MKKIAILLSLALAVPAQADPMSDTTRAGSERIVFEYAKDICPNALKITGATNISKGMTFIADEARRAKFTPQEHKLLNYMCSVYALGWYNKTLAH